jgi:peptidoglycan/LPS O-acetylase OafA/YrhL
MRQKNNFDLLRFVLASMVFLVHAHVLSGEKSLEFLSRYVSSDFAVKGFFVVSGFLIFRSYYASRSLADYFDKRIRRIYPAYACVILVSAVLGGFISQSPLTDYVSPALFKYVAANLVFLNFLAPNLPGVFSSNAFEAINGALWTLKIEVAFYVAVPVIVLLFRRFGTLRVSAALYALSVVYLVALEAMAERSGNVYLTALARQLPGQLAYFIVGGLFHFHEAVLRRWAGPMALLSVMVLLMPIPYLDPVLAPVCVGFIVMYFATGTIFLGNFGRYGDLSYGVYIIHFPVLQFLVWKGWFAWNAALAFSIALVLIIALALGSWHWVEKRWLRKSSHYVLSSQRAALGLQ